MKMIALFLIRAYQLVIAPILGNHCRFYPSCSAYTAQAIEKYGVWKGVCLGSKRILRCHPFHRGGFDPVP
jgi:putative membrane protein insertion efficiency factor